MRKIDRLKASAKRSCELRGHNMSRFRKMGFWSNCAECQTCKATVCVDVKPAPNGIDIGGNAVALNCPINKSEI